MINCYKPFWKSASSDIVGGRVHLDIWRIETVATFATVHWAGWWTDLSSIHLGDTPTCDVRRGRFAKRFVTANQTHTLSYNMSPLMISVLLRVAYRFTADIWLQTLWLGVRHPTTTVLYSPPTLVSTLFKSLSHLKKTWLYQSAQYRCMFYTFSLKCICIPTVIMWNR